MGVVITVAGGSIDIAAVAPRAVVVASFGSTSSDSGVYGGFMKTLWAKWCDGDGRDSYSPLHYHATDTTVIILLGIGE
jgi:hypothetical protein